MKLLLRIDDVGRLPNDKPEEGFDTDLSWFRTWRNSAGLDDLPAVYGVVPAWINSAGQQWLIGNLDSKYLAVHGWDHARGQQPGVIQMKVCRSLLGYTRSYIAPFNDYCQQTLMDWGEAGGHYFFGGFPQEHHIHPRWPHEDGPLVHLSAYRLGYGKAADLITKWPQIKSELENPHRFAIYETPVVITLHAPWEKEPGIVAQFVELIKEYLVDLDYVEGWLTH